MLPGSPRHALTYDARPTASNPHPFTRMLIQGSKKMWKEYVEHDFVKQLAMGTLPRECFLHFIKYVLRHRQRAPCVPDSGGQAGLPVPQVLRASIWVRSRSKSQAFTR